MPAVKFNLKIEENAAFQKTFIWKDGRGRPINLTGYTAKMQIRERNDDTSPVLLELTTENGQIVITPLAGKVELKIPGSVTDPLTWKTAYYDLMLIPATGIDDAIRLVEGSVRVSPGVTELA